MFNFGSARKERPPSVGTFARSFVALGLLLCLMLVVVGFGMAGAMAGFDNPPPAFEAVLRSFVGMGVGMAIPLGAVYLLLGGAQPEADD